MKNPIICLIDLSKTSACIVVKIDEGSENQDLKAIWRKYTVLESGS